MKLIVEKSFWEVFPDARIFVLQLEGIDNHKNPSKESYFTELLKEASKAATLFLEEDNFAQNTVVREWREAFSQFKTKKGARSSIEALLKRVSQKREFLPINPLVDIYNSISLRYGLPCGGEDMDCIQGNMHLGKAKGGEAFFPLGAEEDAPALPEEIIYFDEAGAICRNFNWREAQRTMLTEETTRAILVLEAINEEQVLRAKQAIQDLKDASRDYFGIEGKVHCLSQDNPTTE